MDEGQFGFELVFKRQTLGLGSLNEVAQAICEAAADGLSALGVNARYRPRNDIEVDGRKISGTGGFFDGDTIFYQGTVLVEMDANTMLAALKVPQEKLARRALDSAGRRVTTLRELLGAATPALPEVKNALLDGFARRLDLQPHWGEIASSEEALAARIFAEEIGSDGFVAEIDDPAHETGVLTGSVTGRGGSISAHVRLEGRRIREALITGDFFVTPPRTILDLEAGLRGVEVEDVEPHVLAFFASAQVGLLSASAKDFADAIRLAIASAPHRLAS